MKVLYATYRHDPLNPDLGSSVDYLRYRALVQSGFEVKVIGPITNGQTFIERTERFFWRFYKTNFGTRSLKFPLTTAWRASKTLHRAAREWQPDLIFSIFPSFFVFYRGKTPVVWELDTTFAGQEESWQQYGKLPLAISVWEEKRALSNSKKIITMSEWSKRILDQKYKFPVHRIEIIPMPSALPAHVIPTRIDIREKVVSNSLKLLLVGRVYERKGIDIAIEVVRQLNEQGLPAQLTVCGLNNKSTNTQFVQFVGPYHKSDPVQLQKYVNWYKWAHLLLHPARFEAAGIVPSEAAAFGTPTITNDTGGLATTVKHGESGIVLPRGSAPEAYVNAIRNLVSQPETYYELRRTTRQRYERELNSKVAGKRLAQILKEVVDEHHQR